MLRIDTPAARLRTAALLEGISYLVLLFIAMPLKYLAGRPLAVTLAGSVHGLLFLCLCAGLVQGVQGRGRHMRWALRLAIASVVPFGTLVTDRGLRAEEVEERREEERRETASAGPPVSGNPPARGT